MKILDIGANDGWWYQQYRQKYPNAEFVLIEANPNNEPALKLLGVRYYLECLSDCEKEVDFFITKDAPTTTGASYYLENTEHFNDNNLEILKLKTTTLDMLFLNETFDIVKMDVQGSEVDIIKGGTELLKRAKEVILEVPKGNNTYNIGAPHRDLYFDAMYELGFMTYEVLENINNLQEDIRFFK